jgi:arylsulfatase A-like enzyme
MERRAVLLAMAVLASACMRQPTVGEDVENVVVISLDGLGQRFVPPYDESGAGLPHFERFAARGVAFRNAFSSASWTLPAHGSLFTGLYPDRHGLVTPGKRLTKDEKTLAALFRERGFETAAFTGGGFLSAAYGFGQGFERYDGWTSDREARRNSTLPQSGVEDGELFDRAVAYLREPHRRSFFLFVHTYFLHDYYKEGEDEGLKSCVLGTTSCSPEVWEDLEGRYRERVAGLDQGLGRLLDALEETGLDGSTLVVLLSDHGEGFEPERNRIHHGGRLHSDLLRIPLLVSGPGITPGLVDDGVSIVDVAPTLAEIAGLAPGTGSDGISFAKRLYGRGDAPPPRTLYASEHHYRWVAGARVDERSPVGSPRMVAAIHRGFLYVRAEGLEELYDLRADPDERRNLSEAFDLEPFREALSARASFEPGGETMILDSKLEQQLRSLGYIQ